MAVLPGGMPLHIASGFRQLARATPDASAVVEKQRSLSFRALDERASRLANVFLAAGLRPLDRVAVVLGNRLEYPEIICGIAKAGLTFVPINTRLTAAEMGYILSHAGVRAMVVERSLESVAVALAEQPALVLCLEAGDPRHDYESALAQAPARDPLVLANELDAAAICYTSGTTGHPKGVMQSHRSRVLLWQCVALAWGLGPGRRAICVSPMYFGGGFNYGYGGIFTGTSVAILPAFDPEELLATVAQHRAQTLFLVPTHAQMLRELGDRMIARYDTTSLERITLFGAPTPGPLRDWLRATFPDVQLDEHYGSTEAGIVCCLRAEDVSRKAGSVGVPWSMTEVRLVDAAGKTVDECGEGEIFSRSPFVMSGYVDDPIATQDCSTPDGFVSAGDIARADEEGFLFIVDRKKDMIISGGSNVYTFEVEEALRTEPSVADVAVFGIAHELWGEQVVAAVILRAGQVLDQAALDAHCRLSLAGYKVPRRYAAVPAFPRNASGKVLKRTLRETLMEPART